MNIRPMLFISGVLVVCVGAMIACALGVSLWYGDSARNGLALALVSSVGTGSLLALACRKSVPFALSHREGLTVVGLCWVAATLLGALPYVFTGQLPLVDAVFESASGFTTTGATVLTDIEAVPRGLLMWRSLTHWLGGMGIIVFSLAILPLLGVGGMQLYKAEVPGPSPDKIAPRMQDTAKLLWAVYGLLTIVEIILLLVAGMDLFDAVNHTFATVATGGFSTKNASIAAFPSPVIQWIIIVFMFAAGVNFTLHYRMLRGNLDCYHQNDECRAYVKLFALGVLILVLVLVGNAVFSVRSAAEAELVIRAAAFQVVSLGTTTGFVSENYSLWPPATLIVLLFFTFMGGCAGSTGGGFKVMRLLVLSRAVYQELFLLLHPHSVRHVKVQGRAIPPTVLAGVVGFLLLYLLLLVVGSFLVCLFQVDVLTSFSAVLTCLSNVGPGLGLVGPVDNFHHLPDMVKVLLSLIMLLGRLEIYAILIVFVPEFWKR